MTGERVGSFKDLGHFVVRKIRKLVLRVMEAPSAFKAAEKVYDVEAFFTLTRHPERNTTLNISRMAVRKVSIPRLQNRQVDACTLAGREGLTILSNVLTLDEQWSLAVNSLCEYLLPPNATNLTLHYGPVGDRIASYFHGADPLPPSDPLSGSALTTRVRWATLGLPYDWTRRVYATAAAAPFPPPLSTLVSDLAACVGSSVRAEAAIVNYYALDSTLGGHLDDAELYMGSPIVSISIGCAAIFLIGGKTKEEAPDAIYLRSGDVVVMAGASRLVYHGVPRILPQPELEWLSINPQIQ